MEEEKKRVRTYISEDNKKILEEYYKNGMTSKGKQCAEMHTEAEQRTGLPLSVVLEWIGNHHKKESGRKYTYTKTFYRKGLTGYNMFVHENSEQLTDIKQWGNTWKSLSEEEKNSYKDKARSTEIHPDKNQARKILLQDLHKTITDLEKHGVSMSALGVDDNGNQVFVGSGKSQQFFESKPNILADLLLYCSSMTSEHKEKSEIPENLRNKAATHLNQLYKNATGKNSKFPYKAVENGDLVVSGLPQDVLPLRLPSHYGKDKLKKILTCQTLKFEPRKTEENTCDVNVETNNFTETSSSSEAVSVERTAELGPVASPPHVTSVERTAEQCDLVPAPSASYIASGTTKRKIKEEKVTKKRKKADKSLNKKVERTAEQCDLRPAPSASYVASVEHVERTAEQCDLGPAPSASYVASVKRTAEQPDLEPVASPPHVTSEMSLSQDNADVLSFILMPTEQETQEFVIEPSETLYEIEKILKTRTRNRKKEVFVKWKGYEAPTWINKSSLINL